LCYKPSQRNQVNVHHGKEIENNVKTCNIYCWRHLWRKTRTPEPEALWIPMKIYVVFSIS
jgi:hypothetical protein